MKNNIKMEIEFNYENMTTEELEKQYNFKCRRIQENELEISRKKIFHNIFSIVYVFSSLLFMGIGIYTVFDTFLGNILSLIMFCATRLYLHMLLYISRKRNRKIRRIKHYMEGRS